jgi:hypothetical protein
VQSGQLNQNGECDFKETSDGLKVFFDDHHIDTGLIAKDFSYIIDIIIL